MPARRRSSASRSRPMPTYAQWSRWPSAALVRRSGRPDEAVKAARQAVRGCLAEVAEAAGRDQIDIEIEVVEQQLDVRVRAGTVQRSVTIPAPPTPPG